MPLRIKLNGNLVPTNQTSPIADAEIKLTRDRSLTADFSSSFSANLTFYGDAYYTLLNELILAPGARANQVKIEIYDDCCQRDGEFTLLYVGKITSNDLSFCSEGDEKGCRITATSKSNTSDDIQYSCIRTKVVSANNSPDPNNPRLGFQYQEHPYIRYCYKIRPNFLHDIIIILGFAIYLITFVLIPITAIISGIVAFLNALGAGIDFVPSQPGNQTPLEWFLGVQKDIGEFLSGCEEGAISPYVRSYIGNVCNSCGLTFESSILNDPSSDYYNLVYFSLPARGGDDDYHDNTGQIMEKTVRNYFDLNAPLDTGAAFLDDLAKVFNAVWWIEGGVLYFEQQPKSLPIWLDLVAGTEAARVRSICFKIPTEQPCAIGSFLYRKDMIDTVSSEVLRWYNDYVDYQQTQFNTRPYNPNLSGECKHDFPYSPANFRKTGTSRDVIDTYAGLLAIVGAYDKRFDYAMVLERGTTIYPKLLIHDAKKDTPEFDYVVRRKRPNGDYYYNEPMWVAEGTDDPAIGKPAGGRYDSKNGFNWNLYRFWAEDDPTITEKLNVDFTVELDYICEDVFKFYDNGVFQTVLLRYPTEDGLIKIGQVKTVSFKENLLVIEGTI